MILYVFDGQTLLEQVEALSYTDEWVVCEGGSQLIFAPQLEFSLSNTENQCLRAKYKVQNPSDGSRIEQLEELMAQLIFGGEAI